MSAQRGQGLSPELIGSVVRRVLPSLTAGFSPAGTEWAGRALASGVVPAMLDGAQGLDEATRSAWAEQVAEDLIGDLGSLEPAARWEALVDAYQLGRLTDVGSRAYDLALRRAAGEEVAAEADDVERELRATAHALESETAGGLRPGAAAELSDSILDCDYARTGSGPTSLRLAQQMPPAEPA